ncbi:transposon tf2-11 polyprotein [Plakobranchus ocellatus]|uniref:Transposon tf2-11 polyprotein n=1 Tax=Plakobranchus ocellatus TaxID=259542 RepID=A0AAV4AI36_9GAST|nr:transposon tf2-11 polyprotein [Plakobranchus ocellatus]
MAECEASHNGLKSLLTEPPVLNVPDLNKTFVLQSDASDFAVGAFLLQEHNWALLLRCYASPSPQQGDLRLLGPPSGQGAGGGARTRDRRVPQISGRTH